MTDVKSQSQDATTDERSEGNCYVALTHSHLDIPTILNRVRSPKAGALVLFAGTTRDNFAGKPVVELEYTSYKPAALRSMLQICTSVSERHGLTSIVMIHRLGVVPIGEESILIAVAAPHRRAAWRAGEEALEECKEKVEVWKKEEFGGEEGGVWRANRDGAVGVRVDMKAGNGGDRNDVLGESGDVVRPGPPIEKGHGPVVHPK